MNSTSPLVHYYRKRENEWSELINKHIPGATLLRWGCDHRVFKLKKKVFKIESSQFGKNFPDEGLLNEYRLLTSCKILSNDLNPKFYKLDNRWDVLEIDFIDGRFLEDLWNQGEIKNNISISKMMFKVFLISISGISYKQLRARHTILTENKEIVFIDFGNSSYTNPVNALISNFSPVRRINSKWEVGRLASLVYEIIRSRFQHKGEQKTNNESIALQRWKQNSFRSKKNLPISILKKFDDNNAYKNLIAMEEKMSEAIHINPIIALDAIALKFDCYEYKAKRDWGYIWDSIRRNIDFDSKKIIDLGSAMGGAGVFARNEGASKVIFYDNDKNLLDASMFLSKAFGYKDNEYHLLTFNSLISGDSKLKDGDIIFILSLRLQELNVSNLIQIVCRYHQVVICTNNPKKVYNELKNYGYSTISVISSLDNQNIIMHAIK